MTKQNQDFTTYAGDDSISTFSITDAAGAPLDLSGVTDIIWNMQRDLSSSVVLTKNLGSGVAMIGGGSGGQFTVTLGHGETANLTGYYIHQARLVDGSGNVSTVTLGRVQVGRMPVSSYSGDPSLSNKDAVRFWLRDTDSTAWKTSDAEIAFALTKYPNPLRAAAMCARTIAASYSSKASKRVGDLSINFGEISKNYLALAAELESKANMEIWGPYAGGISNTDRASVNADTDRSVPPFTENQFENPPGPNPAPEQWDR